MKTLPTTRIPTCPNSQLKKNTGRFEDGASSAGKLVTGLNLARYMEKGVTIRTQASFPHPTVSKGSMMSIKNYP